jgi:hypothetical protein
MDLGLIAASKTFAGFVMIPLSLPYRLEVYPLPIGQAYAFALEAEFSDP